MDSDLENEEPILIENGKRRSENDDLDFNKVTKRARTLSTSTSNNTPNRRLDFEELVQDEIEEIVPPPLVTVKYRRVLRHIPSDVPYIPVTTESRVYLRILQTKKNSTDEEDVSKKLISTKDGSNRKLFGDWDGIKNEARRLKDKFHINLAAIVDNENVIESLGRDKSCDEDLWVEKYKPKCYLDLLSEESTNKTLLNWLKLWDKSVFGSDYLSKTKLTKEKYAKLEAKEHAKEEKAFKFQSKHSKPAFGGLHDGEYDEMGRPKLKIALLYGPPGLGKTTCGHVVAKQAGYSVREMNASDDRSVDIFRKVLGDALQSRSEIFHDGKPNCLIIDEIDGAPLATVNVLIELISGNATEKGKKKLKKVLKRPIICICNDLFAPSLKELKKYALLLQFYPITVSSLSERLHEISSRERLYLDNATIQSLCDKSECDIRSCLSTLQFMKKKKCTPKDALFSQIGMKDKCKGLFAVWSDIFTIPDGKKKQYEVEDNSRPEVRFKTVRRVVQSYGEYEKLLSGVFENYLRVKCKDCYFDSILEGLSWTSWFHEMNSTIEHSQNYVLMGYLPLYFVKCHFLFGQRTWFKLNFPSNDIFQKLPRAKNMISSMLSEITPSVGRFLDPYDAVVDLFPSLMSITQPATIRPVPTQIWTVRERETLRNVVEVMITYNLSFTQTKNAETGAYHFILEPDIGELAKFKLQESQGSKRTFPYAVKQLVAREIETEKMRRSDTTPDEEPQPQTRASDVTDHKKPVESQTHEFKIPKPVTANISPKIKIDPIMTKDFFGRSVALSAQTTQDLLDQKRTTLHSFYREKASGSNVEPIQRDDARLEFIFDLRKDTAMPFEDL